MDDHKKWYKSLLNPKLYKRKLSEWARSSHFEVDYDNNQMRFGNDRFELNLGNENTARSIGARIGRHNFGLDYDGGFKFRHTKNDE